MKKNGIQTLVLVLFAALAAALLCACSGEERPAAAEESATLINLNGSGAEIQGGGAAANGNIISIRAGGVYFVSGKLENGQIIIDTGEAPAEVSLVLGGAEINCANDAAIYLRQAEKLRIRLEAGSENSIRSGREADMDSWDESRTGSALYAEDDVDIEGEGTLSILGLLNSGLICKDDLEIKGGNITVLAANNGLRGSESVEIKGGTISVTAGNDGIKSTSAKKEGKGYIRLSGVLWQSAPAETDFPLRRTCSLREAVFLSAPKRTAFRLGRPTVAWAALISAAGPPISMRASGQLTPEALGSFPGAAYLPSVPRNRLGRSAAGSPFFWPPWKAMPVIR